MRGFRRPFARLFCYIRSRNPNISSRGKESGRFLSSCPITMSSLLLLSRRNPQSPCTRVPSMSPWMGLGGQKRSMFIQTQSTPNPLSLMFYPGKPVMEVGSADFPNARTAMTSPLAKSIFAIDGISRVFFGADFVTVTKSEEVSWDFLKPEIFAAIMDFYSSGKPLFLDSNAAASMDTAIQEDDSETVAMIKELLETRIRPSVQDDGGDIEYRGFDPYLHPLCSHKILKFLHKFLVVFIGFSFCFHCKETGIVKLKMQGACSGCPSSSVTLKSGIENMLMHYVPEVRGVEEELDNIDEETPSSGQLEGQ